MSDIKFNCPHCKQWVKAPVSMLGQRVNCSACNGAISLSSPSLSKPPPAPPPPATEPLMQQKACPYCSELILATARKCKHCGEFLNGSKSSTAPAAPIAQMVKEGSFVFTCPYLQAYSIVERAMTESEVKIKDRIPEKGLIKGKLKYGINPFGITVTATFYSDAGGTQAEVAANLTDAFDTFGVCKKKVAQISDRIRSLTMAGLGGSQAVGAVAATPQRLSSSTQPMTPPSYVDRAGPSSKGKAITGFFLSLGGLLFGPSAIVGLIMCSIALTGISTSTNKGGEIIAIVGLVMGVVIMFVWVIKAIGI